jgi:hypothetical protein
MKPDGILQTQDSLTLYGDGPFLQELGHASGCSDVGYVRLVDGYTVVGKAELAALLDELNDYVWRYAELQDEPRDGACNKLVDKTTILIHHLRSKL